MLPKTSGDITHHFISRAIYMYYYLPSIQRGEDEYYYHPRFVDEDPDHQC